MGFPMGQFIWATSAFLESLTLRSAFVTKFGLDAEEPSFPNAGNVYLQFKSSLDYDYEEVSLLSSVSVLLTSSSCLDDINYFICRKY